MVEDAERIQLMNEIEDTQREIEQLEMETSVFDTYFSKKNIVEEDDNKKNKGNKNKGRKAIPIRLTPSQKYDIANFVNEELIGEIESKKKTSEKIVGTLKAVLEETETRISDLKRDAYEFKRDVVVGAENPRTGKIMTEKVLKYFDDKFKHRDVIIDKLRLKNTTLKSNIQKLENQLIQKEEVGDVLHYIDFHQLQIENKQFIAKIEERNDELLLVKLSTGKTIKCLNEQKSMLNDALQSLQFSQDEIIDKRDQLDTLQSENAEAIKNIKSERKSGDRLRQNIQDAVAMPDIADYIQQKKQMYECEVQMRDWKKRIDIHEMHLTNSKRQMNESGGIFSKKFTSNMKVSQSVNF